MSHKEKTIVTYFQSRDHFFRLLEKNPGLIIIKMGATWCGPCRMIGPVVEELHNEYEGKAVIGKVNVDQNPSVSAQFGVRNIPTILFIKGGEVVDKSVGAVPKAQLASKLDAII